MQADPTTAESFDDPEMATRAIVTNQVGRTGRRLFPDANRP